MVRLHRVENILTRLYNWLFYKYTCPRLVGIFSLPLIGAQSIVMSVFVCLSAITSSEIHIRSAPIFCECYQLLLARSTSGGVVIRYVLSVFIDDVICAQKPRLLDVVDQLKHSAQAALGLAINCAQYY